MNTQTPQPTLYILEKNSSNSMDGITKSLEEEGYKIASSVLGAIDSLSKGRKVVWSESEDSLDSKIEELIRQYSTGMVSFMYENKYQTFRFDTEQCKLVVVATRTAVENSFPHLFSFVGQIISK